MQFTPFAVLLEFNFAGDEFAVFARPIIDTTALGACELEKLIL